MIGGGPVGIDDDDLAFRLQRGAQVPEEGVGLRDLMVHVDHEHAVEAGIGQARIVRRAELDGDIVQPVARHALAQPRQHRAVDVLRQHAALGAHPVAQPHGVVALARADIGHGHAGPGARPVHHDLRLVRRLARRLIAELRGDDIGDRAIGFGKGGGVRLGGGAVLAGRQQRKRSRHREPPHRQSTSSTSTASPVTRCASAAAMKGSSAPSSTSPGAVLVTPVRRSFTI